MTILIVEDDQDVTTFLAKALRDVGHTIECVTDGSEAWARIEEGGSYSTILTDLRMPELDGMSLLTKLRQSGRELPVILITGFGDDEAIAAAALLGAFDFLDKPVELAHLRQVVTHAIAYGRELQELTDDIVALTGKSDPHSKARLRLKVTQKQMLLAATFEQAAFYRIGI